MKKFIKITVLALLTSMATLFCINGNMYAQKVDVDIEKIKEKCKDKPYEDRVRVTVSRFNVTTRTTNQEFGDNMATMFTNALHEINCFRVLESIKNQADLTDEISFGQQGYTNGTSSPQGGKMLGAQVVFTGEITEYAEGNNSTGALGIKFQTNKVKLGFIVKALNPETRDIYFTKSIETESSKPGGYSGVRLLGLDMAGGTKTNAAVADALERGIIKAAYEVAEEMEKIPFPKANSGVAEKKVWNASNCPVLASGSIPTIMVIVPENYNVQDYRNYNFSDLSVETAMIRKFTEAGFTVIDPAMFAARRKDAKFNEAFRNPMGAASIGSEFGADIVVVGDASSTLASKGNMIAYRARVDAKAISTSKSSIVASNGFDGGATDVSENSASKKALSSAGEMMADYVIERLCTNGAGLTGGTATQGPSLLVTSIQVKNTNLMKLKSLTDILATNKKVKEAKKTGFKDTEGGVDVRHEGSTDDLVDFLLTKGASLGEITEMNGNKITITMK